MRLLANKALPLPANPRRYLPAAELGRYMEVEMHPRSSATTLAVVLGTFPVSAHAQYVPPWLIAAALSPILVFLLCIILGCLTRSIRIGTLHEAFVLAWIVLFALASYFIENDYVIWTPLTLYFLHSAFLVVLIILELPRRIFGCPRVT